MQQFISKSEDETIQLSKQIAKKVSIGTCIALHGNLGAGKSAFCRGFIQSLCPSATEVPSPTFTLLQLYETPNFDIYHFDMYRLKQIDEAYELGLEDAFVEGVCLIEWPEKINALLPKNSVHISIEIQPDQSRLITIEGI